MKNKPDLSPLLPDLESIRARRQALVAEVQPERLRRRHTRRPLRAMLSAGALLAIGAGAAWAAGAFTAVDVSPDAGVACFETASLSSATGSPSAVDPVAKCAKYWREGVMDTRLRRLEREGRIPKRRDLTPHLVACASKGGGVLVFPGPDGTCERLGFVPLPPTYRPDAVAHARAYRAWFEIHGGQGEYWIAARAEDRRCPAPHEAATQARRALTRLDPVHRRIDVGIAPGGPCAIELDVKGARIVVVTASQALARERFEAMDLLPSGAGTS